VLALLDSSVLVAAMVEAHPDHGRCLPWLQKSAARSLSLLVAAHSLAETFAVLTRLPLRPRIAPATAEVLLRENVLGRSFVVALSAADYRAVLARQAGLGLSGGAIYDALIARAAQKAKAERVVTLNRSDFLRVWPEGAERILAP
jgi:predicted nucleic acid-binding protein